MSASPIPGIKVFLLGGSGAGKTYSIKTLIEAGITPMVVFTENSQDVLGDVDPAKLHWTYVPPVSENLTAYMTTIKNMGLMSFEQMTKMVDSQRGVNNRFYAMLEPLMNFKCDRTGESFGNVGTWGTDRALVIDSLSGLSIAAIKLVAGERPALNPSDYGMAQNAIEGLVNQLCTNFDCHVVLTAHVERETDQITGGTKIMAGTVGKALAPKLPRFFTDVIYAKRNGTEFLWDTADPTADLKGRNCPISSKLPPSFLPLIERWKARGGIIGGAKAP
jgi:hypothetical protein